jgi:hypothetical protein
MLVNLKELIYHEQLMELNMSCYQRMTFEVERRRRYVIQQPAEVEPKLECR